jgi:hypothetical protein
MLHMHATDLGQPQANRAGPHRSRQAFSGRRRGAMRRLSIGSCPRVGCEAPSHFSTSKHESARMRYLALDAPLTNRGKPLHYQSGVNLVFYVFPGRLALRCRRSLPRLPRLPWMTGAFPIRCNGKSRRPSTFPPLICFYCLFKVPNSHIVAFPSQATIYCFATYSQSVPSLSRPLLTLARSSPEAESDHVVTAKSMVA